MISIDRFEGDWAILEWEGRTFSFPRALIPQGSREGDVLGISLSIDRAATDAKRHRTQELEKDVFKTR